MPTKKPRCTITCDEEFYKKFEDYRFDNRYKSESEAALALLKLGFETIEKMSPEEYKDWVAKTKEK